MVHCLAIVARRCAPAARGPAPLVLWLAIVAWCPVIVACFPVTVAHCPSPASRFVAREARRPALLARCPSEVIGLSALPAESEGPMLRSYLRCNVAIGLAALLAKLKGSPDLAPLNSLPTARAMAEPKLAYSMQRSYLRCKVPVRSYLRNLH